MKVVPERIFSPIKKYGGKSYLAKKIAAKLGYRPIFVNGFAGTCINSLVPDEGFDRHICIDLDPQLMNFWKVLQKEPDRMVKFLGNTEYSEENFNRAKEHLRLHKDDPGDSFFDAIMYFVCNRMSRSADMQTFGWSDRHRRGKPEYISSYESAVDNLQYISYRIQRIEFVCGDYADRMIEMGLCDDLNVVSYIDPPYTHNERISKSAYGRYEFSDQQHMCLLRFVKDSGVLTYLSGYNSSLYESELRGCHKWEWTVTKSSSQKKSKPKACECLWVIK